LARGGEQKQQEEKQKALECANLTSAASISLITAITPSTEEGLVKMYESGDGNYMILCYDT